MAEVLLAAVVLVATHFGLSSTPARAVLASKMGEGAYLGAYSLLSLVCIVVLIMAFNNADRFEYLWPIDPDLYWIAKLTMPVACVLMVGAFTAPNPTQVGMEAKAAEAEPARGMIRITRHPLMWAFGIWALGHIVANGDSVAVVFFATFAILALGGTVLIDIKKARTMGPGWQRFSKLTSNVPFAAILGGRNRLAIGELVVPLVVGLALYGVMFWGHAWVSGVEIFW